MIQTPTPPNNSRIATLPLGAPRWEPFPKQIPFLSSPAFEALFGGEAGPGKTDCLVMDATRQIANPRYTAILFRRTFSRLKQADGIIARMSRYYPYLGGKHNQTDHYWRFPSGAMIYYGHMQHLGDEEIYQGAQFTCAYFDELTEFLEQQYMYIFSRVRAEEGSGLHDYIRAGTNPGNIGHEWVKARFITVGIRNRIAYFARIADENGVEKDVRVEKNYPLAKSRAFYPASRKDNPKITAEYEATLAAIKDPVRRAQLMDADWDAQYTEGRVYPEWSSELNVSTDAAYNPLFGPLYWAVDDGYQNPRVILFIQIHPSGRVHVCGEIYERHKVASESIARAIELSVRKGWPIPEVVYYDPSALEFAANCWNVEYTRPNGEERKLQLFTSAADNRVAEGIKLVRQYICDEKGVRSLLVHPDCINLIREMSLYLQDIERVAPGGEPPPIKANDHAPDALRYFIATGTGNALPRN